jgi:hypothetical protein
MPLTIHIWGGLGSQLYALGLLIDLKEKFPNRQYRCIFHTGGVTERLPEIVNLLDGLASFSVIHDFKGPKKYDSQTKYPQDRFQCRIQSVRKLGIKFLLATGLVSDCNERTRVFPWTVSIRGHYRTRTLTHHSLQVIASLIKERIKIDDFRHQLVIHYRLGDLIGLKDTISPSRLALGVKGKYADDEKIKYWVYSDSPDLARELLSPLLSIEQCPVKDIWSTLNECIASQIFVGTNSKISYWAIYLRLTTNPDSICMIPSELEDDLLHSLGSLSSFSNLQFY